MRNRICPSRADQPAVANLNAKGLTVPINSNSAAYRSLRQRENRGIVEIYGTRGLSPPYKHLFCDNENGHGVIINRGDQSNTSLRVEIEKKDPGKLRP